MNCCCQKVYRLCDTVLCDEDLVLPHSVAMEGEHTLELEFLGDVQRTVAPFSIGNAPTFPTNFLNERFTYVGRVLDPAGQVLKFTVNAVEYDCFEFTTKRALYAAS